MKGSKEFHQSDNNGKYPWFESCLVVSVSSEFTVGMTVVIGSAVVESITRLISFLTK